MNKKFVVITGSSGGIGNSLVKELINKGYFVFGIDLFPSEFKHENYLFIKCDLTNEKDITNAYKLITKTTLEIDYIVNLAGIFMMQSMIEGKEEDLRKIIDVNFFSSYRLNRSLFPLLKEGSRIVMYTSEVARYSPQPFNGYYALSKIMLDKYSDILRRELNYLNIKVIKVQSGAIKTGLLGGVNSKYETMVNNSLYYKKPLTKLKKLMDDEINKQVSPDIVTQKLVKIIEKKKPKMLYKIRNSFKLRFLNKLPEGLQDYIYRKVIK